MRLPPLYTILLRLKSHALDFDFTPDTHGFDVNDYKHLPLTLDLATSQRAVPSAGNSWWTSSYIRTLDDRSYFIVSHVGNPGVGFYRYSILDINNPEYYQQYAYTGTTADPVSAHIDGANVTLPTYGFEAINPADTLAGMRTWSTSGFEFNLSFEFSSPVILNGGSGTFTWGPYSTTEWSLVAGVTRGSFVVDNVQLTIDPERSLTWYDRQIVWIPADAGPAASHNWTWFQLHFDHEDGHRGEKTRPSKISAWIWDYADNPRVQFATTHSSSAGQQQVMPLTEFSPSNSRTWTSPGCGGTYPLEWDIALADGMRLRIEVIRDEQEFCNPEQPFQPTYEGFVSFHGIDGDGNEVGGFGLVEVCLENI
ncbi:uncharacterized protein DSM5745_02563 [Aspergillus mulundensis]|uniref:AttH domain-containing protein n=1 Tax=Aspergillus mulundensis TaxID=1810919 RepID=A0A3D8SYE7_9EURO|nr:Uncharacterized protein DSM5745_02563 [Aspergillus mulundensis]RDW90788.1 Uncharacterized protein DSM5745_02563 [Aspergillus mulundensis]